MLGLCVGACDRRDPQPKAKKQQVLSVTKPGAGIAVSASQEDFWKDATKVSIPGPVSLAWGPPDVLYIGQSGTAEVGAACVMALDLASGNLRRILGIENDHFSAAPGDAGLASHIRWPESLAVDPHGSLWIVDNVADAVLRLDIVRGKITHVVGGNDKSLLTRPSGIAINARGRIFVSDLQDIPSSPSINHRIVEIDPKSGSITTVLGSGLRYPKGLSATNDMLYIADEGHNGIVQYDLRKHTDDILEVSRPGHTDPEQLSYPSNLAIDGKSNLYVAEGKRIRVIDLKKRGIRSIADDDSPANGTAIKARLHGVSSIAVDHRGSLFVSEPFNNLIRRIDLKSGRSTTIAGNGLPDRSHEPRED